MQEAALEALIYSIDNLVLTLVVAFLAGFLASRIVAADRRPGVFGFTIIGLIGFFLSHFVLSYYQLNETLDGLHELRFFIDLVGAFFGSFVIAGVIHFLKPS
jgi:uncharacterized membrane protein YeaQ/YmgE (transglycosylase-associated protein family)